MAYDLSLSDLFQKTFGHPMPDWKPKFETVFGDVPGYLLKNGAAAGSPYYANDLLGKPIYLPVVIKYPDTSTASGSVNSSGGSTSSGSAPVGVLKNWNLNYCVVQIDSSKTVIKTPLTERNGEVIEMVNTNSYDIVLQGFFINQVSNESPEADIMMLKKIYEINEALWLQNALTDIFLGNNKVVITSMNLPSVKGIKNVRPFELKMISDSIFNLIDLS